MIISSDSIVSNSDMIKNYRVCRERAENFGRVFVMKNNQPDAVLFSVAEYRKYSAIIERIESLNEEQIKLVSDLLPGIEFG